MIIRIVAAVVVLATLAYAQSSTKAVMYLSQFGYLPPSARNPSSGQLISQDAIVDAVREFQAFAGLDVTGDLDNATVTMMGLPRCGVKDKVGFGTDSRSKRFALQGSRWRVKDLTYRISKYPRHLSKQDTDYEVKRAFSVWADVTPLTFTKKTSGPVHIEIKFERGEHGDGDPFDGPGGTLAHAFFPVYGGDAHFDDSEKWTVNTIRGTNLFQVAAHEFGHSLGLSHSDISSALMAPFYRGYQSSFQLDDDDVDAIQTLYGRRASKPGNGVVPTAPEPPADEDGQDAELCNDATVDTLFNSADGDTFVFKGQHYWKLTRESIAAGYPKLISKSWPGLPGNIDAAFTYRNGKTYFFKGKQYWRYNGRKVDGTYPKLISDGFPGAPDYLDAAMVWNGNGKIYFFKGSKFWKFDPMSKPPVKSTYPKPISNWEGIPNNLDAVLTYTNGWTYFFKKGQYYRFNDRSFSVDEADPPFPRPAGYWWFGCRSETKGGITGETHDENYKTGDRGRSPGQPRDGDITDIIFDGADPMAPDVIHKGDEGRGCNSGINIASSISLVLFLFLVLRI